MAKPSSNNRPPRKNTKPGGARDATRGAANRGAASRGPRAASGRPGASRSAAPRGTAPRGAAPRGAGVRSTGPRGGAGRSAGPRSAGPRSAGPRSAGPRSAGPRSAGPRRAASPRASTPGVLRKKGEAGDATPREASAPVKLIKRGEGAQARPPRKSTGTPASRAARSFGDRAPRGARTGGVTRSVGSRGPARDGTRPQRRTSTGEAGTGLVKRGERSASAERLTRERVARPTRERSERAARPTRDRVERPTGPTRERGPRKLEERPSGRKTMIKRKSAAPAEPQERDVMTSAIPDTMRLNRFIASSGVTSRRKADELITQGKVKVNGKTVLEMGVQVNPHSDQVVVDGEVISIPSRQMYLVMNKPKDYITTAKDEKERKTVFDLLSTTERVYNVGRLDRNTTGVLIFTNDGELTNRLTHPSYEIAREYHATLDKPLATQDAKRIAEGGLDIGDGDITGTAHVAVADRDPKDVILTITEGKNREVRRIFETLGYDVEKLDRLSFGGIAHKGMGRGEVRPLTRKEVRHLKKLVGMDEEL